MSTKKDILKTRAVLLAQKPPQKEDASKVIDVVEFRLGDEVYGIESKYLGETQRFRSPTEVPYLPVYMLGIIYHRGQFVLVVDIARFLNLQNNKLSFDGCSLIMMKNDNAEFYLVVDEIIRTRHLSVNEIQSVAKGFALEHSDIIKGVSEDAMILIDAKSLLNHPSMKIYEENKQSKYKGVNNA